jgi:adenosine deaminase
VNEYFTDLEYVTCYKTENDKKLSRFAASLNRYIKNVLSPFLKLKGDIGNIILVEIDGGWNSQRFIDAIKSLKKEISGILFFTFEDFPRGDEPGSPLNKSRLIREFFQHSFNAVTANPTDIFNKVYQLIYKIVKNVPSINLNSLVENLGSLGDGIKKSLKKMIDKRDGFIGFLKNDNDCQKIAKLLESIKEENKLITLLSMFYPQEGIHSTSLGHKTLRKLKDSIGSEGKNKDEKNEEETKNTMRMITLFEELYDYASIFASNPLQYNAGKFKILIIEDNWEKARDDISEIIIYFPEDTEIYITLYYEWRRFIEDETFWVSLHNGSTHMKIHCDKEIHDKIKLITFLSKKNAEKVDRKDNSISPIFPQGKFIFNYIIVDLLLGHYNEGNRIINRLVKFRNSFNRRKGYQKTFFDIITLSLSEEANDISRSLKEGSLYYIPKKRIAMLPAVIAQLEKGRVLLETREEELKGVNKTRNFGKLYQLPEIIQRKLKTEPFLDLVRHDENNTYTSMEKNFDNFIKIPAQEWIKIMPKADLHCHLGGSMRADSGFFLSLNMLKDLSTDDLKKLIKQYVEFIDVILEGKWQRICDLFKIFKIAYLLIIEFDLEKFCSRPNKNYVKKFLNEKKRLDSENLKTFYQDMISSVDERCGVVKKLLQQIKEKSKGYFDESNLSKLKQEVADLVIERKFLEILKHINRESKTDIPGRQIVNLFNVLLGILGGKKDDNIETFWKEIEGLFDPFKVLDSEKETGNSVNSYLCHSMKSHLSLNFDHIIRESEKIFDKVKGSVFKFENIKRAEKELYGKDILGYFISAKQRQTRSLAEYLGGCEFTGAEQLKNKENIVTALFEIIKKNVEDNVRLLELKASPDGYVNKNLTLQEAVQTILLATDLITLYFYERGKFIRVNYIFTVKRHKAPEEAAVEVSAAIANKEREKFYQDIKVKVNQDNVKILNYEWKPSRVIGVDLAGLEKGNPARNFVNDFYPLFKTNSFITIHAGEEDNAQSIWEAVYLLHADRIGHGLTLSEKVELKELFKNIQICIEMNPISNTLTNAKIEDIYPFYEYILEGLNITINTDNPAVSDSTLSEEFIKAAELFQTHRENIKCQWIPKWEILRVIKNSFRSSFLERQEKQQFIRAVEEEIYQKIIDEYGF